MYYLSVMVLSILQLFFYYHCFKVQETQAVGQLVQSGFKLKYCSLETYLYVSTFTTPLVE